MYDIDAQAGSATTRELIDEFFYDYNVADCSLAPNSGQQLQGIHQRTE